MGIGRQELNGAWKLRGADGQRGAVKTHHLFETDAAKWMDATVPGEVHLELMKQGLIEEPTEGLNALSARWVEENLWSYRRSFTASEEAIGNHAWLIFEGLDYHAKIYLNEELIGEHANFYRPCKVAVTGKLRKENLLVIVLDSGLHMAGNKSIEGYYENSQDHELHKRIWLRKPQSSFGWDWSTRLVNVGIHKPVALEWATSVRLDDVVVLSEVNETMDEAVVTVRAFVEGCGENPVSGKLTVRIGEDTNAAVQSFDYTIEPGMQRLEAKCTVANPKLWWPAGHGEQHLANVEVELHAADELAGKRSKRIGFRKLRINQDPHPSGGSYFYLEVNDRPVFAKGANAIPPDMIFQRADRARYEGLISRALEANFNFLRVWGGGIYETDDFYELCDEHGIMVWQDFVFACADYPVTDATFMSNVKQEAIHNVRRLAHHPSLVMYCGNNENEWHTFYREEGIIYPDYALYHHILPRIVQAEDPGRYYQPSSPFSPDHQYPNANDRGDQHPWTVGFENNDFRDYREMICRFPNEGGILGTTSLSATNACLPEGGGSVLSYAWQQHDNAVDSWFALSAPDKQISDWIGLDPRSMSIEQFVYYGGLIQGEGLREYIDNFRRRMFDCASAIFWMFNDCWPATRSWTVVDYYLNRTPAFYPVKRAFQPISVVAAKEGQTVRIFGINETEQTWSGELQVGLFRFSGAYVMDERLKVELPPNTSVCVLEFSDAQWEEAGITDTAVFARLLNEQEDTVARNRLILPRFVEMKWDKPHIEVVREDTYAVFRSDVFAWGVCIDLDGTEPLPDNFFDIWPGMAYRIPWPEDRALPAVRYVGNLVE
ncbi:beta-mannosidase [Paenibacillus sp. BC26]|nr:beta-mannosidase [Paenibacillus sp. BC26]